MKTKSLFFLLAVFALAASYAVVAQSPAKLPDRYAEVLLHVQGMT